jgi:hypothetical protein
MDAERMPQSTENSRGLTAHGAERHRPRAFRSRSASGCHAPCLWLVVVLISLVLSGCRKPSLETVPVYGTITYQGKPVPYGVVKFQPADATRGRSALAFIAADGTYDVRTLKDARGLVPGEYRVTVVVEKPSELKDETRPSQPSAAASGGSLRVVRSGIKLAVDPAAGKKVFDISLDTMGQSGH